MFVGRKKELNDLCKELTQWKHRSAVLVYGKRRVGKSTLIMEAARTFNGIVVNHICVSSTFEGNMELLYKSISDALSLPFMRFDSVFALMEFLEQQGRKILLIIDEYPYLKQTRKQYEVDSLMQAVIDRLPDNVKLILCGSYVTVMKELLREDNPLFGRFSLIQHIRDFDYLDAAAFYPELSVRDKVAYYAVFGGSPYVLENLDVEDTLESNIRKLLLPETGLIRSHLENVLLREIRKTYDVRILEILGNGKRRYSDIREKISSADTGILDKQLKILLDMETIRKTEPINRHNDKKKQFYEIVDSLARFYFTYIFGNAGIIGRIGEAQFFENRVSDTLNQFISRRLEGIAMQYFRRMAIAGKYRDMEDYGSYWYDDPETRTNGEFDCVIKRTGERYDFYECKYFDRPMSIQDYKKEKQQLGAVKGIAPDRVGFVCTGGFSFKAEKNDILIDGEMLYRMP